MPKYNLYRIIPQQKDELIAKIESVGLEKISSKTINGFNLDFYFSKNPDEIDIWWTEVYKHFFNNIAPPKNKIYFAILLIYNTSICYVVSLGKSHFYLKSFCDLDFGLNLAERIVDETDIRIKNSKFYKSRRNKIITTYQRGSSIDFNSGESMHYIKAKTIDERTWGKIASFGHSAQFNIKISPDDLPNFITLIEKILQEEPRVSLPKVFVVKEESKQKELDNILVNALLREDNIDSSVSIEEISLSGVNFIFSDQYEYSFYLKDNKKKTQSEPGELNLTQLKNFIQRQQIDLNEELNDIKIEVHKEDGNNYSASLKSFLEFVEEGERYCLIDGKWYQFNQSYINFLTAEVNKINWEEQGEIETNSEDEFIDGREKEGFIKCHKIIDYIDKKYRVEKIDMYKDGTLYFVKIGKAQTMNYTIDQAINTVKLLQNNQSRLEIDGEEKEVKKICLWLIFDRRGKINYLSDIKSLIFQMKLVDWRKTVVDAGYEPIIYVSYKRN